MSNTSYEPINFEALECDDGKQTPITIKTSRLKTTVADWRPRLSSVSRRNVPVPWNQVFQFRRESDQRSVFHIKDGVKFFVNPNWKYNLYHGSRLLLPWALLVAWIVLIVNLTTRIGFPDLYYRGDCTPASNFIPPYQDSFNKWDISNTFQITVGFGRLPFSTAKIIDVAWDVVVGRGGQALLVAIGYTVFTSTLTRIMENSAVPYGTFAVLTFETATLSTIFRLIRDFLSNTTLRAKLAIFWIILSSSWVTFFPTYISAMTGYAPNIRAYVNASDGSIAPWEDFHLVDYMIHDGWRIGLDGNHLVLATLSEEPEFPDDGTDDECASWYGLLGSFVGDNDNVEDPTYVDPREIESYFPQQIGSRECMFIWHVALYGTAYGYNASDQNSKFYNVSDRNYNFFNNNQVISLPPPTLNISMFYLPSRYLRSFRKDSTVDASGDVSFNFVGYDNVANALWGTNNNITYGLEDLKKKGQCVQQETYKWGFSFLLLFLFCVLQAVWSVGMYIMWMDAYLWSRYHRAGRDMGVHRAALDFSKAIRKDMGEEVTENLGNTELRRRVRRNLNGCVLSMDMLNQSAIPMSRAEDLRIRWRMGGGLQGRAEVMRRWSLRRKLYVGFAVLGSLSVIIIPSVVGRKMYCHREDVCCGC